MTAPAWCPGAVAFPSSHDAGSMLGGGAFCTWHTYEAGYDLTVTRAARGLIAAGNEVTLVFNPVLGGVGQLLPATRAARGLRNEVGGVETNRRGRIHIQIEVSARAARPWTKDLTPAGRASLRLILAWLDALGIPRVHPAGNQGPLTGNGPFNRSTTAWKVPGHFCHANAPENTHWDHGGVLLTDIWAVAPLAPPPPPPEDDMPYTPAQLTQIVTAAVASLPEKVWVRPVTRDIDGDGKVEKVPAIQELADAKSIGLRLEAAIASLPALVAAAVVAALQTAPLPDPEPAGSP